MSDASETRSEVRDDELLLGVDAGLTKVKAALFTTAGDEVAVAARRTPANEPEPGHREVDHDALWETTADAIRDVVRNAPTASAIAGIGVAGHGHGLYALDEDDEPVRPGIRSTDSRATDLVAAWNADGTAAAIREAVGYEPFAADPLSLLGWLRRHEPEAYDDIERVLFCKDLLKYRLTDVVCTDEMEGSVFSGLADDADVVRTLGLDGVADVLPPVVPSWKPCGTVTDVAADETGLAPGTPVASGLHDVGAVALGAGAHEPAEGVLVVGTWGQSIVVLDSPTSGSEPPLEDTTGGAPGLTRRYLDGRWLRYKGNRSAATCVDWFVDAVGDEWRRRAAADDISAYEVSDRVVDDAPVGAGGVVFHPYLHGSTDDPDARGGFFGLSDNHTGAHMLRAIYEGVAISQVERLGELEPDEGLETVRLGGGGARSEVWADIFADVRGGEILVPAGEESGARGAAMCGGLAAGVHPDHETAVAEMVSTNRRHTPTDEHTAVYRDRRNAFEAVREAIQPLWKRLSGPVVTEETNE